MGPRHRDYCQEGVRSPSRRVVVLGFFALVIVACSQSELDNDGFTSESPFQREILADGSVDAAEMERAVSAYVACVENVGLQLEAVPDPLLGVYTYRFSARTGDELDALMPETVPCHEEFLSDVELVWADQIGVTEEEDRAFYEAIASCLRGHGFDVPDASPATLDRWISAEPQVYDSCFAEAEQIFFSDS